MPAPYVCRYDLLDGEDLHRQAPLTFEIPAPEEIDRLRIGDYIKIGAKFVPDIGETVGAERFWVQITAKSPAKLAGEINNDLVFSDRHGLVCGGTIAVERRHILSTLKA